MINRIPLKQAVKDMFPCTEDIFYQHIDKYQDFNIQYGQVVWYYDQHGDLIAIRDGEFMFYVSENQDE